MSSWKRSICVTGLSLALAAGWARADHWDPISYAGADLSTQRDGDGGEDEGVYDASLHLRVDDNPNQNPQPDSFAEWRGRARAGVGLGSYAAVGGNIVNFLEGDGRTLESDGGTYTSLAFRVESATLAPGAIVPVDITLNMKGALQVAGTGTLLDAAGTLYIELFGHDDDNEYYRNFLADVTADREGVFTILEIDSAEAPDAQSQVLRDAVRSTVTASETNATVDWTQTFRLELEIGEEYALDVHLSGFTMAINPEDAFALADFFTDTNGGAATLESADPAASIILVPEPATAATLALASCLVLSRRRRPVTLAPRMR